MEHYRPNGYCQGYFCSVCGAPGLAVMGNSNHGPGKCKSNPELVKELIQINSPEAEQKREFLRRLKRGRYGQK